MAKSVGQPSKKNCTKATLAFHIVWEYDKSLGPLVDAAAAQEANPGVRWRSVVPSERILIDDISFKTGSPSDKVMLTGKKHPILPAINCLFKCCPDTT